MMHARTTLAVRTHLDHAQDPGLGFEEESHGRAADMERHDVVRDESERRVLLGFQVR